MAQKLHGLFGPLGDLRFWQMLLAGSAFMFCIIFILPAVFLSMVQFSIEPLFLIFLGLFFFSGALIAMIFPVAIISAPIFGMFFNWRVGVGDLEHRAAMVGAVVSAVVPATVFYLGYRELQALSNKAGNLEHTIYSEAFVFGAIVLLASAICAPIAAWFAYR